MTKTKKFSKKSLQLKSARRELRQAKKALWEAEERYEYWYMKYHNCPISDKRWGDLNVKKELARNAVKVLEDEVRLARTALNKLQGRRK